MTSTDDGSILTLLSRAIGRTEDRPELHELHAELRRARMRLNEPMRVAIVGLIKAGKSTILNALLGQEVAATGPVETTFNVNWLRRGLPQRCEVVFKSGRPRLMLNLAELATVTDRVGSRQDVLREVKHVEVFLNLEVLERVDLIDTPGLSSVYADDEQNTRDFLQLHGKELTETTARYSSDADAVLYLFSKGMHESDEDVMRGLSVAGAATPINAIGVLTKVDGYFDPREAVEPLETGERIARRLRNQASLRKMFYTVVPVCGLLGCGAASLDEDDWGCIRNLAASDCTETDRMLRAAQRVLDPATLSEVPAASRERLLRKIGIYGMHLSIAYARQEDPTPTLLDLRRLLAEQSGVPTLLSIVREHFGGRSTAIKTRGAIDQVRASWWAIRPNVPPESLQIGDRVLAEFEEYTQRELKQALSEIELLRRVYEGNLDIDEDEAIEIRRAFGEEGRTCMARLGCPEDTALSQIGELALSAAAGWRAKAQAPILMDRYYEELCTTMARTYERIHSRTEAAQRLINL